MSESTAREIGFPDNRTTAESAAVAGKIFDDIMGDFELTPAVATDGSAVTAAGQETVSEGSEVKLDSTKTVMKEVAEKSKPPLTRLEAHVLRSLSRALSDGDAESAQELLGILADHPNSTKRVLEELKRIKEASDDQSLLKISWEQGTDRNDQRFVRLYMTRQDSGSSRVEVVIGSDGRHQAVRHDEKNNTKKDLPLKDGMEAVRPVEALRQLSVKKELLREATERRQPQPQPPTGPRPPR
jgi:hypothetical protein